MNQGKDSRAWHVEQLYFGHASIASLRHVEAKLLGTNDLEHLTVIQWLCIIQTRPPLLRQSRYNERDAGSVSSPR